MHALTTGYMCDKGMENSFPIYLCMCALPNVKVRVHHGTGGGEGDEIVCSSAKKILRFHDFPIKIHEVEKLS